MKANIKINKGNLKNGAENLGNILLAGIAIAGIAGIAIVAPNAIRLLEYFLPEDDMKRHYKYRAESSLKRLLSSGYVQKQIIDNKIIFRLTNKGKLRYESLKTRKVKNGMVNGE